jgi:ribulose-phosphate 3-epimerase
VRALVGAHVAVEVDGGIESHTAPACRQAGANVFVAGSAIFSAPDPAVSYRAIAASVDAA